MYWNEVEQKKDRLDWTALLSSGRLLVVVQTPTGEFLDVRDVYLRPHPITGEQSVVLDTRETV